jgi:hypothetical protein
MRECYTLHEKLLNVALERVWTEVMSHDRCDVLCTIITSVWLFTATHVKHMKKAEIQGIWLRQKGRSWSPGRVKNYLFSASSRPALGPIQPLIHCEPATLSSGVKRPRCEADHSPPTIAKVKKMWTHTFTPPCAFMT